MEVAAAKKQVDSLIVCDLKEVLGKLGQSRSGRKEDLKVRLLALLNAGDPVLASRTAAVVTDYYKRKTFGPMPTSGTCDNAYYNKPKQVVSKPPGHDSSEVRREKRDLCKEMCCQQQWAGKRRAPCTKKPPARRLPLVAG